MAVGPDNFPKMHSVKGVKLGSVAAKIKDWQRDDLLLIELSEGSRVVGTFTQNAFCAAPVHVCKKHLSEADARYLLINAGNANAGTGEQGMSDALRSCELVAKVVGVSANQVLPYSTGVIGELLELSKFEAAIPGAVNDLDETHWPRAADAIMTTDTRPKGASEHFTIDGKTVTITGISKGSGMIKPNMATMLAYIATDAAVSKDVLQEFVVAAVNKSFNRITVDGDTSTNDACMLMATGQAGNENITDMASEPAKIFFEALVNVFKKLAHDIVRDGEGATKFVSVNVSGGQNTQECVQVAYAVAHSPLVKTALFASDANWGRILAAVGYSGVNELDVNKIHIYLDDILLVENGGRAARYTEEQGASVMAQEEITIRIHLGRGSAEDTVWTTDLSHDYVSINADYRT